jgi:hypothetical protein
MVFRYKSTKKMIHAQNLFMSKGVTVLVNHKLMCPLYKTDYELLAHRCKSDLSKQMQEQYYVYIRKWATYYLR